MSPPPQDLGALGPVLQLLAAHPGKFQLHAQGALRFRERLNRAKGVSKSQLLDVLTGLAAGSPCGEPPEVCRRSCSWGSISECGDTAARCEQLEEGGKPDSGPLKSASSEPSMGSCPRGDSGPVGLEGPAGGWPADVACRLERAEAVVRQCLLLCAAAQPGPGVAAAAPRKPRRNGLRLVAGASSIPHPEKASSGGADSCFIARGGAGVGVADGVGEWEWRFRCNPRAFADELMDGCREVSEETAGDCTLDAREVALRALRRGFRSARAFGSATALVAWLSRGRGLLGVANLGDSALLLLRRQRVGKLLSVRCMGRTREQQHSFNCPYQLACLPTEADFPRLLAEGHGALVRAIQRNPDGQQDTPEDSDGYVFPVQEGDLLVLGTDGVFDNLHDREICQLANHAISPFEAGERLGGGAAAGALLPGGGARSTNPERLAEAIALAAAHRSRDLTAKSPFSAHAQKAGLYHIGGKMDDITCVCAWLVREQEEEEGEE